MSTSSAGEPRAPQDPSGPAAESAGTFTVAGLPPLPAAPPRPAGAPRTPPSPVPWATDPAQPPVGSWGAAAVPSGEPVTRRLRRVVESLPDWEPLPPGEFTVRRPGSRA